VIIGNFTGSETNHDEAPRTEARELIGAPSRHLTIDLRRSFQRPGPSKPIPDPGIGYLGLLATGALLPL
jgi:hypothetical protein